MRRVANVHLLVVGVIVAVIGCHTDLGGDPEADTGAGLDAGLDATDPHDQAAPTPTMRVAAIQWDHTKDVATISILDMIKKAAAGGAELVVTPSEVGNIGSEPAPSVGDEPLAAGSAWKVGSIMYTMARAAVDNQITLVFTLWTVDSTTSPETSYHSSVAIDDKGKVIARHDQFHLSWLTEGTSLATSFFDYRGSKVGLMIGNDAVCLNILMVTTGCTQHHVDMLKKYLAAKPRVVLLHTNLYGGKDGYGSYPAWGFLVARALKAWLVVGNQRKEPYGKGGGIFKPDGSTLAFDQADKGPVVVFGNIPLPSS